MKFSALIILLAVSLNLCAQTYNITGKVIDARTNKPLMHASIKIAGTSSGTAADDGGNFILKVKPGSYDLITSYIGYFSDTSSFYITDSNSTRNIFLSPTDIYTEIIEVAGEDPAYEIIRKAIRYKKEFRKNLNEYNYDAYSKFVIRSNINPFAGEDVQKDSSGMSIFGILESETTGYFKKPDLEKLIVKSKRETANISRGFALPLIVNFYDEKIDLGENKIPSPLNDDAFDDYEYKLTGTTSLDSSLIYKIKVINTSSLKPQFLGTIYIMDSIFALVKVDLQTSAEAVSGIDYLNFSQKFSRYSDKSSKNFWMPTDVEITANGSFAGLFKFKGDVFTIISDYRINEKTPAGIFNDVIIKVEKDAKKDSAYWKKNQIIKNTEEESEAYSSIERNTEERRKGIRFSGVSLGIGKYFTADLLESYKFSSAAGHQIGAKINFNKDFGRYTSDLYFGYGFDDAKTKYKFNFGTQMLNDRSLRLNFSAYDFLSSPFMDRQWYHDWDNTGSALISKKDIYTYYYSTGYSIDIFKKIIPQIGAGIGFMQDKQNSAKVTTDYSFTQKENAYTVIPPINNAFRRTLSLSLILDPNLYRAIDWGDGDISRFRITEYPVLSFKTENSWKDFLGSTFDNRKYTVEIRGENNFAARIKPKYMLGFRSVNGNIPYQDLGYFDIYTDGKNDRVFAVMNYRDYYGDKLFYFLFDNDFGKLFPSSIPVLKSIKLIGFFNAGRSYLSGNSTGLSPNKDLAATRGLFTEAGFILADIMDFVDLYFGWRLSNYKEGNNFNFYLSF
ncbi:MAG: DUF5686 and carboxypeptidase regulatory-like domain-containing protein [Ignavibacteria bacterium]|nr:DUF5686 and carboxypeptidase regulatory-like domain-containing protein [Ignavibacteria bacterium]